MKAKFDHAVNVRYTLFLCSRNRQNVLYILMYPVTQLLKMKVKISFKYKDLASFNNEPWKSSSQKRPKIVSFSLAIGSVTGQGQKEEQFAASVSFFL